MLNMKIKLPIVALAALLFAGLPVASSSAYVGISVGIAPPPIPVYEQPYCPGPGYLWTPGYWSYSDFGYYWVPGVWVLPPRVGFLWTPGYWGYRGNRYVFNDGYWGSSIGFYGGINYGFGYGGRGYYGGRWEGNNFRYNTAVTRVNTTIIKNTYVNNNYAGSTNNNRTSFNGPKGVNAQATAQEKAASKGPHIAPTKTQRSVVQAAKNDPALHAKNNNGKPNAEAVDSVRNKVSPNNAAENGRAGKNGKNGENQAGAADQAGAAEQNRAEKQNRAGQQADNANQSRGEKRAAAQQAKGNDNQAADHARPAATAEHAKQASAAKPHRNLERNQPVNRRPAAAQRGPQRPHPVMNRNAQQAGPRKQGPGQGEQQNGKKKKRKNGQPDGQ